MKKHKLILVLTALVPALFIVWSAPPKNCTNESSMVSALTDLSSLGALSGLNSLLDTFSTEPSHHGYHRIAPQVSWSTSLALAKEARENGNLESGQQHILKAIGTLLFEEYNEKRGCSNKQSYHVAWPHDQSLVICLKEATEISREMADYKNATNYAKVALNRIDYTLKKRKTPELLFEKAVLLNTMASIRLQQAIYDRTTVTLLEKTGKLLNECTGPMHSERGALLHNLAMVQHYKNNHNEAIRLYMVALSIRQQTLGEEAEITAETYGDLGLLYVERGKFDKGIPLVEKAISVYGETRGGEHPWTNWYRDQLGYLLLRAGRFSESARYLEEAWQGRRRSLGENHKLTIRTRKMAKAVQRIVKRARKKSVKMKRISSK
jgi:tetratricopeptide (TPR) repeat protein